MRITVSIPYFRARPYIRQAVESILAQTHQDLRLVVVNDGDEAQPWAELAHIDDPRLLRFDLPVNRGMYFANTVVLNATPDSYFATQDADDWSEPTRLARLLAALQAEEAHFVGSAGYRHTTAAGRPVVEPYDGYPIRRKPLTDRFYHRLKHQGLYRTAALRAIGGYYAGFRVAYDMLLTNLILMTGDVTYVDEPLYHRRIRAGSLTTADESGFGSNARMRTVQALRSLYGQAFVVYAAYLAGELDRAALTDQIRGLVQAQVGEEEEAALEKEVARLRRLLP